jgi:DNA-binding transcriptional LysR family regulator
MLFRKFEYLIALAKEGHFARAAAACQVSQPTLSAALRQLEIEVGVTVVKRGQRYSGLTEQGEQVLAFAQKITTAYENLLNELQAKCRDSARNLQVAVIPSAMPLLSSLAISYRKEYPSCNLKLLELNPSDIRRSFEEFTVDLAVTYLDKPRCHGRRTYVLYDEEYSFLVRSSALASRHKSISWHDAARYPLCLLAPAMLEPGSQVHDLLASGPQGASRLETNSITVLQAHLRSGNWASVLPSALAKDLRPHRDFISIPLPIRQNAIPVGVVIPSHEFSVPLAEAFFKIIVSSQVGSAPIGGRARRRR